jgi:hypothetical protein
VQGHPASGWAGGGGGAHRKGVLMQCVHHVCQVLETAERRRPTLGQGHPAGKQQGSDTCQERGSTSVLC